MHNYMTKNFKPCGYTPDQIAAGLRTHKICNIMFTMLVDISGKKLHSWIKFLLHKLKYRIYLQSPHIIGIENYMWESF